MVVFLVMAFSVLSLTVEATGGTADDPQRIDKFVWEGLEVPLGKSLQDLRRIGRVQREVVSSVPNPHDNSQVDEIRTIFFDGLVVEAYFPNKNHDRFLLREVTVTKQRWRVREGLSVGVQAALITEALGAPTETTQNSYKYCGETECVIFQLRRGVISKITFQYYVD